MTDAPPEHHEAWANASKSLLGNAMSIQSELASALEGTAHIAVQSEKLGKHGPRNVDRGPTSQKVLDERLMVTKAALNSVDGSAQRLAQVLGMLNHERQAKWGALKVVEWRLALRERRPKQELFKDHLQDALENEMKVVEGSRKILLDRYNEVKIASDDCDANKVRLNTTVRHMICFGDPNPPVVDFPKEDAAGNSSSPSNAAPPPAAEEPPADGADGVKRPDVPSDSDGLIKRAPFLHESSMHHLLRCEKLINSQRSVCEAANLKVMAAFKKRNAENKDLKQNLEAQMHEMEDAISKAEKSIERMKKNIQFFGQVELQPKVDSTIALVEKITEAKQTLADDLLRKVVSMRIDDCCRKITAERTMQAPETMPVAALLEGAGTKAKLPQGRKRPPLNRQQSSPAFVGAGNDSAASLSSTALPPIDSMGSTTNSMNARPGSAGKSK